MALIDLLEKLLTIGLVLCIFGGPFFWLIYAQREYNKAYGYEPDDDDGSMEPVFSPTWDRINDCAAPFWANYWGPRHQHSLEERSVNQENAWQPDEMNYSSYDPYDPYE